MTVKGEPNRCKGFAFAEFARYDRMELCLSTFHHSTFADGKSEPRKINMELTYVSTHPPIPRKHAHRRRERERERERGGGKKNG